jgi:cytochrome c
MNGVKMVLFSVIISSILCALAFAGGDAERGKTLFNDPKIGGATSGKSCNTCHPSGSGLEQAGTKKEFHLGGLKQGTLEEAINFCIEKALNGNPLEIQTQEMQDLTAYIKSLSEE